MENTPATNLEEATAINCKQYRVWMYHETEDAKICTTKEAKEACENGWKLSPAYLDKVEPKLKAIEDGDTLKTGLREAAVMTIDKYAQDKNLLELNVDECEDADAIKAAVKRVFSVTIHHKKKLKATRKQAKQLMADHEASNG